MNNPVASNLYIKPGKREYLGLFGITVDWILQQLINDGDWQLAGEFDLFDREGRTHIF